MPRSREALRADPPGGRHAGGEASLARRIAAATYESLLLAALAVVVGFVFLPFALPPTVAATAQVPLPGALVRIATFAALFLVWGAYCVALWSRHRRSLPMKTWRLALREASGGPLSLRAAALRYLACWIGPACAIGAYLLLHPTGHGRWAAIGLGFNYAWALIDRDGRLLQDRIASTRLLDFEQTVSTGK